MQEIIKLLNESNLIDGKLNDQQIVEVYKATTEEERNKYIETIQNFLENGRSSELHSAVSYLNIESYIYKNWFIKYERKKNSRGDKSKSNRT